LIAAAVRDEQRRAVRAGARRPVQSAELALWRRYSPSVSRLRRRHTHALRGSGHAGVPKGSREHAQSRIGSKSSQFHRVRMCVLCAIRMNTHRVQY